jgi:hypothetical protein
MKPAIVFTGVAILAALSLAVFGFGNPGPLSAGPPIEQPVPTATPGSTGVVLCSAGVRISNSYFSYSAGWNLIAGFHDRVLSGNLGPIYRYRPDDSSYIAEPPNTPLETGVGYWAYFPASLTGPTIVDSPRSLTLPLPAGEYVLIGNPIPALVTARGADALYVYDPETDRYTNSLMLHPGQGAWAYSALGGVITLTNATTCT